MNPDTAELAAAEAAQELAAPLAPPTTGGRRDATGATRSRWWARLRADPARMAAVRDSARALWSSRLLVWVAGSGTVLLLGHGPTRKALDPPGLTRGLGWLGDLLAAPAARWDSSWFLVIAHYGYRPDLGPFTSTRAAFFPAYPLGLRALAWLGAPPVLAGVLLSIGALSLALYGIHRLTTLELSQLSLPAARGLPAAMGPPARAAGGEVARLAVLLTAFAPMAFFFSAVYSESLYLALSVGLFWCARQGRFAAVGALGALAGATRNAGVMLLLPAVILYLYGPREDRPPDFPFARALAPRYRLRRDFSWLALLPAGVGLYVAYFAFFGGDALIPFHAEGVWGRHFAGPFVAGWDGVKAGVESAGQLLGVGGRHALDAGAGNSSSILAGHDLLLLAFLIMAVIAVAGVLRVLPLAYGAYVLAALALPLSYPASPEPLMSLPRYLVVLFPVSIWLASWLAARPRAQLPVLGASAVLMAIFAAEFATWHWVA
jgi:hypothetical protein